VLHRGRLVTACLPPPGLPGLDPAWSRLVPDGRGHTWHVLDAGTARVGTLVCVHGNPTWSYLWRRFLAAAPPGWRVVAVDQLGMGFSDRPPASRTLAERVADLGAVLDALGVAGPVVAAGHDWGGAVALGWALGVHAAGRGRLRGIVLANTAVHQPAGSAAPGLIRLARSAVLRDAVCRRTPVFVRATSAMSRPALPPAVRAALAAPYRGAGRRRAVADFVADIPLEADHRSRATLDAIAEGARLPDDVPALLLWGPRDPVFGEQHLRDLRERLPHADVQRYERAAHLVLEDAPQAAEHGWAWILQHCGSEVRETGGPEQQCGADVRRPALWAALDGRAGDPSPAVAEPGRRAVSWDLLARRVRELAAGLADHGVAPGHRVALLVPPGADLTAAAYACWRAGASIVVADPGLGPAGLARALRGAHPDHVVGVARGLALARALGVAGGRIAAGPAPAFLAPAGLAALARRGRALLADGADLPAVPDDAEAAVLFTSGATGPAKGVVYRHRQARAQIAALRAAYGIGPGDRLVAAFPPFALYGPALGIAAAVPDAPAPGRLTAAALAGAVAAVDATMVFASPAALRTVVRTAGELSAAQRAALAGVRRVVSAGAPVPAALLRAVREVLPGAAAHTPYGMTEVLPVTDVTLEEIEAAGPGNGVCVGRPLPGVDVRVAPLSGGPLTAEPGVTGEISVAAAHVKDRYDQLWAVERAAARDPGRHRTGDVGHLDAAGRLWVEGRLAHVVATADGPVTPVGVEQRAESVDGVAAAAAVGVGPAGTQQVAVVVVPEPGTPARRTAAPLLAGEALAAAVRAAADTPVAAVLVADALPVDVRHASKVDRARVAAWAGRVLAGERAGRRP
jgi:acyl-CoA synthetase (AMP-forming)/AMP-acid ligase II/pimeloyl-ACP methyl ester carboxylesterase